MSFFYTLDILGTLAFAISGALAAIHKRFDLFGIFIIAFVTALGGGTLRDILIGRTPVSWMFDLNYVYTVIVATTLSILIRRKLSILRNSLFLFDTIGLGVFTIIGVEIGLDQKLHPIISMALGTISATFGGVIRDILCNDIPVIFRKEIYASACIIGALIFLLLEYFTIENTANYMVTIASIITIRILAIKFALELPKIKLK